jgi:vitamin B12 transporter
VTVITDDAIRKSGAKDLAQLLSNYAGISVIGAGQNPGMTESIFMRGANSNQTVIMVDGVPLSDPSSTNTAIDLTEIPIANIDQVEIVRGSHSTLYGSTAIGGAINIITKKQMAAGFHGDVSLLGGVFGPETSQLQENIFLNYTFKNGFYANLDLFNTNINGLDATVDTSTTSATFRSFDRDDFNQQHAAAKIGYRQKKWNAFIGYSYMQMAADYDKAGFKFRSFDIPTTLYDGDSTRLFTKRNLVNYDIAYKISQATSLELIGGYSSLRRNSVDDSSLIDPSGTSDHTFSDGKYEGTEWNNDLQLNTRWKNVQLVAGAGIQQKSMDAETHYYNSLFQYELVTSLDSVNPQYTLLNAFAQFDLGGGLVSSDLSDLNLLIGARYNHHDLFGSIVVYEINPSYKFGSIARLFASYSTGFNAPSLYQLYAPDQYYTSSITRGNPDLQPEYSQSFEVGLKFFPKAGMNFGISFYQTVVNNSIEYVYLWDKNIPIEELGNDYTRDDFRGDTYLNVGTQYNQGMDLSFNFSATKWLLIDGNLSLVKGKIKYSPADIDTSHTQGNHVQLYSNGAFPVSDIETDGLVRRPSTANLGLTILPMKERKYSCKRQVGEQLYRCLL